MPSFEGGSIEEDECMQQEPLWWAFVVSSVATFLVCIFAVCAYRFCVYLCCRPWKEDPEYEAPKVVPPTPPAGKPATPLSATPEEGEVTWMTEAKDWAGELISGQTTTGRILVSDGGDT
ncbi:PREDICTED: calcium-activated potassium channel slo-1-like [Priapulus caudatus]|uniref:Calcium-activated potassium channel slo-1-like n=1 Tax=Priapulus caudatus TaxID=37621 RepID=A0ABM1E5U2_PRICU|nr:PREDICTED: calcium-activated potassium channel slo-1-like [Priapulus caudatus]